MISCYHKLKHKAKQAGVDDFIEKPFNIKQLLSVVDKHIGKNEVETTIAP
jgi:FixJ family two-component response regulator